MSLSEFEVIRRFFQREGAAPVGGVAVGIGDDAAVLDIPPGHQLVTAVDTLVEGRHFLTGCDARSVGHRALAMNLSDLAAMGAKPAWMTLALTLPHAHTAWLSGFARGLFDLADRYAVQLVGGDTTAGPLTVSVQLMGHIPTGAALLRSTAGAGDLMVVTGTLGDAGAGLAIAKQSAQSSVSAARALLAEPGTQVLLARYEYPEPRVNFGMAVRTLATAGMDISDGLAGDAGKLASASGLAAHIEVERLPLSPALRARFDLDQAHAWALAAGDDYELLLSVPPARLAELQAIALEQGIVASAIGELHSGHGVTWTRDGRQFLPEIRGFDHFR